MASRWTEREDQIISEAYAVGGTSACVDALRSEGYDRGLTAVSRRARKIGVAAKSESPLANRWTPEETEVVRSLYPEGGAEAVRARLAEMGRERTTAAISSRAHAMGVRHQVSGEWSGPELDVLRELYPTGGASAVRDELRRMGKDRTMGAINTRATMLGVKTRRMERGGVKVIRNICLDTKLDGDVIERLDSVRNRSQYVRDLVRRDMG